MAPKLWQVIVGTIGIGLMLGLVLVSIGFPYWTADKVTITVSEKERIVRGRGDSMDSKYLVFTEGGEVFRNEDCFVRWKFGSSTLQGRLKVGQSYTVLVYGWRVPFLSWYRNIVRIEGE